MADPVLDEEEDNGDLLTPEVASKWQQELTRYEKWSSDWRKKSEKLLKLYSRQQHDTSSKRKFAMLWANTEVMKPAVQSRPPVPQVSRRYKDKDKVGRIAAELLERSLSFSYEENDIGSTLNMVRDDVLLPGRGTAWVRVQDTGGNQKLIVDYIHWNDFYHQPARVWKEVGWVGKRSFMSKADVRKRFGKKIAKEINLDHSVASETSTGMDDDPTKGIQAKATIFEIWDKTSGKVYFISKNHPVPLEVSDPFLNLKDFWPCPKPVYSTITNESLIPTSDYAYYKDQAEQIDNLTARIDALTDSLKRIGFYPAGADADVQQAIERALRPGVENQMIPVESWAAFAEKGGTSIIVMLPIKEVAETIQSCIEVRAQLIADVYQITGISDVLRGATDPDETATAQQLKSQWGSIRIRDRQAALAAFARDITRISCEIMAENFDFMTLREMANMMPKEQAPVAPMPMPTVQEEAFI